uniref:G_PROTEIN_RECEP_F1_2 domain-containing protein n=1 Tax=Panagrellus redivivus TaxID=6233 RepID=A0A7E4VV55_PANRE
MPCVPFPDYILTIYSFELIFEVITVINAFIFLVPLIRVSTIHIHLRCSVIAMCFATIFRGSMRTIVILNIMYCYQLLSPGINNIFVFLFSAGNVSIMMIEVTIIAERTLSHIMTKKYEKYRSIWVIFMVSVLPIVFATAVTFNTVYLKTIPLMPSNWTMMSFIVFSWIIFFTVLKYHNDREKRSRSSKTLSERYQQAENWRTNRTIIWWCVFCFVHRILSGGVQVYKGIVLLQVDAQKLVEVTAFTDSLLNLSYGIMMNFFPLVFIGTLPAIRRKYREMFPLINHCCPAKRVEPGFVLTTQGMKVVKIQTITGHFDDLTTNWDTVYEKKRRF